MRRNNIIISLFLVLFSSNTGYAQFENVFGLASNNQQLIELAINGAFYKVDRTYRIKDLISGQLFGIDGKDFFGSSSSLGVWANGRLLITEKAIKPWDGDANYDEVRSKYDTSLYNITFTSEQGKIELDSINVALCDSSNCLYAVMDSSLTRVQGLTIGMCNEKQEGWIIWVSENNEGKMTPTIIRHKKGINNDEIEKPNLSDKVLGCVFIVARQHAIGQLTFDLVAVGAEKEGKWHLVYPELPTETVSGVTTNEPQPTHPSLNVTPIIQKEGTDEQQSDKSNKKKRKK